MEKRCRLTAPLYYLRLVFVVFVLLFISAYDENNKECYCRQYKQSRECGDDKYRKTLQEFTEILPTVFERLTDAFAKLSFFFFYFGVFDNFNDFEVDG